MPPEAGFERRDGTPLTLCLVLTLQALPEALKTQWNKGIFLAIFGGTSHLTPDTESLKRREQMEADGGLSILIVIIGGLIGLSVLFWTLRLLWTIVRSPVALAILLALLALAVSMTTM
jgi:hypothetical protein